METVKARRNVGSRWLTHRIPMTHGLWIVQTLYDTLRHQNDRESVAPVQGPYNREQGRPSVVCDNRNPGLSGRISCARVPTTNVPLPRRQICLVPTVFLVSRPFPFKTLPSPPLQASSHHQTLEQDHHTESPPTLKTSPIPLQDLAVFPLQPSSRSPPLAQDEYRQTVLLPSRHSPSHFLFHTFPLPYFRPQ